MASTAFQAGLQDCADARAFGSLAVKFSLARPTSRIAARLIEIWLQEDRCQTSYSSHEAVRKSSSPARMKTSCRKELIAQLDFMTRPSTRQL